MHTAERALLQMSEIASVFCSLLAAILAIAGDTPAATKYDWSEMEERQQTRFFLGSCFHGSAPPLHHRFQAALPCISFILFSRFLINKEKFGAQRPPLGRPDEEWFRV